MLSVLDRGQQVTIHVLQRIMWQIRGHEFFNDRHHIGRHGIHVPDAGQGHRRFPRVAVRVAKVRCICDQRFDRYRTFVDGGQATFRVEHHA